MPGGELRTESPLLIDPCADDPATHLHFSKNGLVAGKTTRGKATVDILNLNRPELRLLRKRAADEFWTAIRRHSSFGHAVRVDTRQPFAGMIHQFARELFARSQTDAATLQAGQRQFEREEREARRSQRDARRKRTRTQYLREVQLRNIGAHKSLSMTFGSADTGNAPWMVILGENGVGKSTLLKAIAFTLAGKDAWSLLGPHAEAILPRDPRGRGEIKLTLSDGETIKLVVDRGRKRVSGNAAQARFNVLGFGATRLLPSGAHPPPAEHAQVRLVNLFDPFTPLGDASEWLGSLSGLQFDWAARALRALLGIERDPAQFFRKDERGIVLVRHGVAYPITSLSDGFQTVIGVACDIMSGLLEPDLPVENAEGLVLIDEIGNHLHPRWRMRIVKALKNAFPRVQFIATTHEPLCLRGLISGEVVVLREGEAGELFALDDLPEISGLTVDQLLSSQYFGLHSTIDPDFEREVSEYYDLLSRKVRNKDEQERLQSLEAVMSRTRLLGDSPREQILLRTIDTYLARAEREHRVVDPTRLPEDVRQSLAGLLADKTLPAET